ncbi:PH domain-containing protein [Halopiger djelfimassiliensis]|uniref:PH domain-containing protein n=1 Tax=Halopiger djelfimassiliensis TaxID=1293047 RepID=UPI000677C77F|nr:PH domain-containing protein [Halopiger djelfimassiliensis]
MKRLHPFSAVIMALQHGVTGLSVPFFFTTFLAGIFDFVSVSWTFVLAPLGFVVGVAYGVGYYYRFEYGITPDTFDVRSGVLSRRSREIPYRRIQNVDIAQGVVQRLLGLAVVSIETAGGGETEATLSFVSESEAKRLQERIRRRTAELKDRRRTADASGDSETDDRASTIADSPDSTAERPPKPDDEPTPTPRRRQLFALEPTELFLYAFTSFQPAAVAGVLFVGFLVMDPDSGGGMIQRFEILALLPLLYGAVITYLLSVAYTFVTYYGFQLGRVGEDFVYERGLIQRYSGSIPAEKVQSVTVTDNPAQRLFGYAGLWIETAGYGPEGDGGSQSAVPLAERERVRTFTENLTGVESPQFNGPSPVARRRYLVRYSLIAAGVVAVAAAVSLVIGFERWYLAAVVFAAVPPAAHLRYAHLGYFVGEDHLVIRRGFWRRRTTVVPYYRIQTVSTRRSIFQRRLGLASLVVDTASSRTFSRATPTIHDVDLEDARDVHGTGRKRLQSALRDRSRANDTGLSVDFT